MEAHTEDAEQEENANRLAVSTPLPSLGRNLIGWIDQDSNLCQSLVELRAMRSPV
jgi:hypothetical protein